MAGHPRIESKPLASFLTTRSRNSELWFVNNLKLEKAILEYAAKYSTTRQVVLYALAIEGNHIHSPAHFPEGNRADFMRDFNSTVAKAVPRFCSTYPGGKFWGKPYSGEFVPAPNDIEEQFFYTVLQAVQDGLVERISDYPGYNCFHDAIHGIEREYKSIDNKAYNAARKRGADVDIKDFTTIYTLKYERIPGYEEMRQLDYAKMMAEKLEKRRIEIVNKRKAEGKGFLGREGLLMVRPGAIPYKTKTSTNTSHRPRVLSKCPARRAECKEWYFNTYFAYKEASRRFRLGELDVEFPEGTYRPPLRYCKPPDNS